MGWPSTFEDIQKRRDEAESFRRAGLAVHDSIAPKAPPPVAKAAPARRWLARAMLESTRTAIWRAGASFHCHTEPKDVFIGAFDRGGSHRGLQLNFTINTRASKGDGETRLSARFGENPGPRPRAGRAWPPLSAARSCARLRAPAAEKVIERFAATRAETVVAHGRTTRKWPTTASLGGRRALRRPHKALRQLRAAREHQAQGNLTVPCNRSGGTRLWRAPVELEPNGFTKQRQGLLAVTVVRSVANAD
jgi:hypothetical protein